MTELPVVAPTAEAALYKGAVVSPSHPQSVVGPRLASNRPTTMQHSMQQRRSVSALALVAGTCDSESATVCRLVEVCLLAIAHRPFW